MLAVEVLIRRSFQRGQLDLKDPAARETIRGASASAALNYDRVDDGGYPAFGGLRVDLAAFQKSPRLRTATLWNYVDV